eukprot:3264733-Amphidinium_carterae.8
MAESKKLYQRNQQLKHKAIWIGRDTTTGLHITLTPEFGKLKTRPTMRLPEKQIDRELLHRHGSYSSTNVRTEVTDTTCAHA